MPEAEKIKLAIDRGVEALKLRPTLGRGTAITRARVGEGLACEIEDGRWKLAADMPEKVGGTGSAPDPGVLGRAALASCLAIGYRMWAARLGIPIDAIEVTVEADYDVRGEFGVTSDAPSYSAVRCRIAIESAASRDDIDRLTAVAEDRSPYLDLFRRPLAVSTERVLVERKEV